MFVNNLQKKNESKYLENSSGLELMLKFKYLVPLVIFF